MGDGGNLLWSAHKNNLAHMGGDGITLKVLEKRPNKSTTTNREICLYRNPPTPNANRFNEKGDKLSGSQRRL